MEIHINRTTCEFDSLLNCRCSAKSNLYNITVNHRRLVLSSTRGHPGRWNDKSVVLYGHLVCGLRDGQLYDDLSFSY